ncbi:MAG TPA: EsaB/YukD family protein [Nocardioides sp.]|uniref:EsaB/YukD family protein n=1 Tax=Nocardioides sp. TaxID=35761 RepID=UPI002F41F7A4
MGPAPPLLRVTVTSRTRRVDLVLPGVLPVADLLPELARCVGILDVQTVYGGYRAVTRGGRVLRTDLGLGAQGIVHGEVITIAAPDVEGQRQAHDDVSEAMAEVVERDAGRWGSAARRQTAVWSAAGLLLVGAGALVSQHGIERARGVCAAVVAVALLAGAVLFSRRGSATLAALTSGHLACLYAGVAGLCWAGRTSMPGAAVALAGVAVLVAGAIAGLGMSTARLMLLPAVAGGSLCAATGLLMQATAVDPTLPLTIVLTFVLLVTSGFPALALSTSGAGRHALSGASTSPTEADGIDMVRLAAEGRLAREILVAVSVTAGLLVVALAPFAVSLGRVGVAIPVLGCVVVMLRTRRYRSGLDVLIGLASGMLGLVSTGVAVLVLDARWRMPVAVVVAAAGVVLLGQTLWQRPRDPRPGRVGDRIESAALVALLPALLVAAGLSVGWTGGV